MFTDYAKMLVHYERNYLANRTAFAKAHGNLTPAWFSSSRTLCLRCFIITRTKAVRKYHYHDRKVMAAALRQAASGTLAGIAIRFHPSFRGLRRASPAALFLPKRIRLLYAALIRRFLFQGTIWLVSLSKYTGDNALS